MKVALTTKRGRDIESNWLHDTTIADFISRYPDLMPLLYGSSCAPFRDVEALASGVILTLGEAIGMRGISANQFFRRLEGRITA